MQTNQKLVLASVILAAIFMGTLISWGKHPYQVQKEITLRLTQQEVEMIYNTIDNAPLSGEIRKPLLQKIASQYQQQMQPPAPVKQDSSKNKKN